MVKKTFKISDFEYFALEGEKLLICTHTYMHLENRVIVCHIIAYSQKKSTVLTYEETGWKENFFIIHILLVETAELHRNRGFLIIDVYIYIYIYIYT
jgi:hypothetical protein